MPRLKIVFLAPFEILLCMAHGAWTGAVDGANNISRRVAHALLTEERKDTQ